MYQLGLLFVYINLFCIWKKFYSAILSTNSSLLNNGKLHFRNFVIMEIKILNYVRSVLIRKYICDFLLKIFLTNTK